MTIDLLAEGSLNAPRSFGSDLKRLRPLRILLADDDDLVRAGTAEMLAEAGHQVIEAASGTEALSIFEADRRIELLITDNLMPGMTGLALIPLIRRFAPSLPILLVTGYASRDDGIAADVGLLAKPFREAGLLVAVRDLISSADEKRHRDWPNS
jgi:CheY-like chemotaxis protein